MNKERSIILLLALFIGGYTLGRATSRPATGSVAPAVAPAVPADVQAAAPTSSPPAPMAAAPAAPMPVPQPEAAAAQNGPPPDPNQMWRVTINPDDARLGPDDALVKVVLFSAFGSAECNDFAPVVDEVVKKYGEKVQIRFKHKLVPPPHPDSLLASEAAMAANAQGKFWPLYSKLSKSSAIDRGSIEAAAQELGLDLVRFKKDIDAEKYRGQIMRDSLLANEVAAHSFPNIMVNGVRLKSPKTWEVLQPLIDEQMKKAKDLVKSGTSKDTLYDGLVRTGKFFEQMGGPPARIDTTDSPRLGPETAKIKVAVYEDFQCPFCGKLAPSVEEFQKRFPNDVSVIYKHMPLVNIHDHAAMAANASMAAMAQGKFWPYHDLLYANQQALERADLERYAEQIGLDLAKFKKDLDAKAGEDVIQRDVREGTGLGVSGTPSVFINGMRYQGPRGYPPEGLEAVSRVYFGL